MVRITVLKKQFNSDIAELLNIEEFKKCTLFQEGQEFDTVIQKPEGFCEDAWKILYPFIFALNHGANNFDACENSLRKLTELDTEEPVICCCCNGIHPVVFKIEKIEEKEQDEASEISIEACEEVKELAEDKEQVEETIEEKDEESVTSELENNIEAADRNKQVVADNAEQNVEKRVEEEELAVSVYEDTKTIEILDRFEGYKGNTNKPYKRLVVRNGSRIYGDYYFHYVIERGHKKEYVGDITFTSFKKNETNDLENHVKTELKSCDIKRYLDKDQYFRFKEPFHLRAQNSHNRTGYGWDWDWSYGVGSYTEGTFYGETTDYIFSGVYISSDWLYEKYKRTPMEIESDENENMSKDGSEVVVKNEENNFDTISGEKIESIVDEGEKDSIKIVCNGKTVITKISNEDDDVTLQGYKKGKYQIITYTGGKKFKRETKNKILINALLQVPCYKGTKEYKMLAIKVESDTQTLYIDHNTFNKHKNEIVGKTLYVYKNMVDVVNGYTYDGNFYGVDDKY